MGPRRSQRRGPVRAPLYTIVAFARKIDPYPANVAQHLSARLHVAQRMPLCGNVAQFWRSEVARLY
jgi:hypothetical protein